MRRLNSVAAKLFNLGLILLFASRIGAEKYFTLEELQDPYFDPTVLEVLEEYERDSETCPGTREIYHELRIPLLEQDGTKVITSGGSVSPINIKHVTKNLIIEKNPPHEYNHTTKVFPLLNCYEHDHPKVLEVIKEELLEEPSELPYNIRSNMIPLGDGQPIMLDQRYFQEQVRNGFFIEAGAVDGVIDATTLYFEQKYGWTGILFEPLPLRYKQLQETHRKAWITSTCLSPSNRPQMVNFNQLQSSGSTIAGIVNDTSSTDFTVKLQCFPLFSFILALGNPRVDYLSLDVEGAEMDILKSIPWDRVEISAMSIETAFVDEFGFTKHDFQLYLEDKGYIHLDDIARDSIFVKMPRPDLMALKPANLPLHQSMAVTAKTVLTRDFSFLTMRYCIVFNVPYENLRDFCRHHFPLDFYSSIKRAAFPVCLKKRACPADFRSLVFSGQPWTTALSDTCKIHLTS